MSKSTSTQVIRVAVPAPAAKSNNLLKVVGRKLGSILFGIQVRILGEFTHEKLLVEFSVRQFW